MKLWATWEVGCLVAMFRSASLAGDNRLVLVDHRSREEAISSQSLSSFRAPSVQLSNQVADDLLSRLSALISDPGTEPGGADSTAAPRRMTLYLPSEGTLKLPDRLAPRIEELLRSAFRGN